jgi:uncharacterized RDD family membrane protein YckC
MAPSWYFATPDEQQVGPVPQEQLFGLIRAGKVRPDTLVWTEGQDEWLPAAEVPLFRHTFAGRDPSLQSVPFADVGGGTATATAPPPPGTLDYRTPPASIAYGGLLLRLAAYVVDALIIMGPLLGLSMLFFPEPDPDLIDGWVGEVMGVIAVLIFMGYAVKMESSSWQATIGKRLVGLIVVDTNLRPLTVKQALARNLVRVGLGVLPTISGLVGIVSFFMILITREKLTVWDRAAGTRVVLGKQPDPAATAALEP